MVGMLSRWVGFCVVGTVSLACSQVGLASVKLFEGSAYHALRLGWLLSSCGKGQLVMLSGLGWLLPCGGKGQLYALTM